MGYRNFRFPEAGTCRWRRTALRRTPGVGSEIWPRYDGLDRAAIGLTAGLTRKFGLGPFAPTLGLDLAGDVQTARESGRAGRAGAATLFLQKRVSPAWRLGLAHERVRYDARSHAFDRSGGATSLRSDYDFDDRWRVSVTVRHRHGGVLSYATPPRPDLLMEGKALTTVTTFDRQQPMVAYYFLARTLTGAIAVSRALDSATAGQPRIRIPPHGQGSRELPKRPCQPRRSAAILTHSVRSPADSSGSVAASVGKGTGHPLTHDRSPVNRLRPASPSAHRLLAALLAGFVTDPIVPAAPLSVSVTDSGGQPVADAVVSLVPLDGALIPPAASAAPIEITQQAQEFKPFVTAVQVGATVMFPNNDKVQHHVYSLSKAKRFEFARYGPGMNETIRFDKPGLIAIGCNIHDWMVAYLVVLPTPWFAKSDAGGRATPEAPPGRFRLEVWHPRLARPEIREVEIPRGTAADREAFVLKLRRDRRIRRAPDAKGPGYK